MDNNTPPINPEIASQNSTFKNSVINQRGNFLIPAGVILVILIIVVGYFAIKANSSKEQPKSTVNNQQSVPTPKDESNNWKTYDNPQMGFTFMYPGNWDTKILSSPGPLTQPDELLIGTSSDIQRQDTSVKLFTYYNPDKLSIKDFNKKLETSNQSGDPIGLWSDSQTTVKMSDGADAYYQKEHYCVAMCQSYVWAYDKWILELVNYPKNINGQLEIFNKIFNSMKFGNYNPQVEGWKSFTSKSRGVSLQYPADWTTSDDEFISQKPFTPGEQDRSKTYNIIAIQKYSEQIYSGYTNQQWFDKINDLKLNDSYSDQRDQLTKLVSGKVTSGESYVIFKDEPSKTFVGSPTYQVKAYVIKGQTIYQFTLDLYDENGLNVFKLILPKVSIL